MNRFVPEPGTRDYYHEAVELLCTLGMFVRADAVDEALANTTDEGVTDVTLVFSGFALRTALETYQRVGKALVETPKFDNWLKR